MPNVQDFDNLFGGTVHNYIWRADELTCSLHLSRAAKAWEGFQLFNTAKNSLSDIPSSGWVVLLYVLNGCFKLVSRLGCPPNSCHK